MKLFNFIQSLLPHLDKSNVMEDMRVTAAEIENIDMAVYGPAADHFKVTKVKSPAIAKLTVDFYRNFDRAGKGKQSSLASEINARLPNLKANTEYTLSLLEELFERDIINEGLTAKKALLLRTASNFSMVSRYAPDLLNVILETESIEVGGAATLPPAVIKHVERNFTKFVILLSDYSIAPDKFRKLFSKIPDIELNSQTAAKVSSLYHEQELDPFSSLGVRGFTGSPIYHVGLVIAEWQASRYKANVDKKKMLELRLLHLTMLEEDKASPKVEREIEYLQGRIDRVSKYLADVESELE